MSKSIVVNNYYGTAESIVGLVKEYFSNNDFEYEAALNSSGNQCIQARKSNWLRNASGTSYALLVEVKKNNDSSYIVTAGHGKWADKMVVGGVATFVAFGFLIIPVVIGAVRQIRLPGNLLNYVKGQLAVKHPNCSAYNLID